jgi:tetratricopeptide (TPR) repeat protein
MVSFEVHRRVAPARVTAVLAASIALLPVAGISQEEFEPVAKDDVQRALVESIVAEQSRGGVFSPELIEPFAELALAYQESGNHDLAAAANNRALQLVRVNEGLYTLDQLPMLQQSIDNAEASGDFETALDLQKQLKALVWRHPTDMRTVPVLRDFGDRQMLELQQLLAGELPPPVRLGGAADDPAYFNRDDRARWFATVARAYYGGAIRILLENQDYTSDTLAELEAQLMRVNYFHLGGYESGRRSLLRQVSYEVAKNESFLTRVNALIHVADWDLLFTQNSVALPAYEEIYALLKAKDIPGEAIDEFFSPAVPVVLPSFLPNPLETHEAGSTGYIDVAFDVRKYGGADSIHILDASATATREDKRDLVQLIRSSDFRPRVTDGAFANRSPVTLRYFLHAP